MDVFITVMSLLLIASCDGHYAKVTAPWVIPAHDAHSFLTAPDRNKRSDTRCNTGEHYCEEHKASCMQHNEQSREYYCGLGHSCTGSQICFLSTPCPAHYKLGCTDNQCLSFPCHNGATCNDNDAGFNCHCIPGWDMATHCSTDYDECQTVPCLNGGTCNNLFNQFTCNCTGRYEGDICEKDCRPGPVDIVFVVDTSSSVPNDVNKSIDFIEGFVRNVSIGLDNFQVGVITYNVEPTVLFDLNDHKTEVGIIDALQTIRGHDAVTFTAPALRKAAEMISSSTMGSRTGVSSYIILLYDGLSSDRHEAVTEATSITRMGGRILTVGIGDSISHQEMLMISGQQHYTFSPLRLRDLYSRIFRETIHTDCTDCSLQTGTDLIILLDTNNNQTIQEFNNRLTAIRRTIENVKSYNPSARIGMYSYTDEPEEVFSLSWSNDTDKMIAAALDINRDSHSLQSNTSHALQHIRLSSYFSSPRKIVMIVSDAQWNDQDDIKREIVILDKNGIEVVGTVAGEDCIMDNYSNVVLDSSQLYYVNHDYSPLQVFASTTTFYECLDNIFTIRQ